MGGGTGVGLKLDAEAAIPQKSSPSVMKHIYCHRSLASCGLSLATFFVGEGTCKVNAYHGESVCNNGLVFW